MPLSADVVVAGAGIVGCSIARELAAAGLRVLVVERDAVGAGSSRAAAGLLAPQIEATGPGPLLELGLAARQQFPALVEELRAETGIDPGYRRGGTLALAFDDMEAQRLDAAVGWQHAAGLPYERVAGAAVGSLEPAVAPGVRSGILFPADHQVDNVALVRALAASAARRGARFSFGRPVIGIESSGRDFTGLRLEGDRVAAGIGVLAAGCWTSKLEGLPDPIPVRPVRGQMAQLEADPRLIGRAILDGPHYLVPRGDGRILAGSTLEDAGYTGGVTAGGLGAILAAASRIVPALAAAPIRETWSGLRPGTPDDLPIIGASSLRGLFHATGHYRNGILLGPITGSLLREWIVTGAPSRPLAAFDPTRFVR